jgi:YHS domain-containing protein
MERMIEVMTDLRSLAAIPLLLVVVLFAARPGSAVAASEKAPVPTVNAAGGTGLKGYDPVGYFTLGQPTPGVDQYTYRWKGVTYRFASAGNLERFKADPAKYLPRYGGYCAYAMAINRIADIDPSRWAIVDGKLYLNNNYLSYHLWSLNKSGNISSADRNWPLYPKKAVSEVDGFSK